MKRRSFLTSLASLAAVAATGVRVIPRFRCPGKSVAPVLTLNGIPVKADVWIFVHRQTLRFIPASSILGGEFYRLDASADA